MQTVENASELHCIALSPPTQDCLHVIAALRGQADAASIKLAGPNSLDVTGPELQYLRRAAKIV